LELSVAQFWSSGIASHEPTCVDFEVLLYTSIMIFGSALTFFHLEGSVNTRVMHLFFTKYVSAYSFFISQIVFHGICVDQKVIALDGSESPLCIVARSFLASERLVPVATLNKVSQESIEVRNFSLFAIY
jgi:tripeptidyl-peptidase II